MKKKIKLCTTADLKKKSNSVAEEQVDDSSQRHIIIMLCLEILHGNINDMLIIFTHVKIMYR